MRMAGAGFSDAQRATARDKAIIARRERRELLEQLTRGQTTLAAVLARADTDQVVAKTHASQLLRAVLGATPELVTHAPV